MKDVWIVCVALLLCLSLAGCVEQETTYTVSRNGIEFQIDCGQKTIWDGKNTYRYELSGDASSFNITVTYPNGSTYWYNQLGAMGHGGWSDDYSEGVYVSGDTLVDVLREKVPQSINYGKIAGGVIMIALGVFNILVPKVSWYLGYGWRYRDAEPSDAALAFERIAGCIATILGIVLLFS